MFIDINQINKNNFSKFIFSCLQIIDYMEMFAEIDKKLMKYFKRKQESPLEAIIKLLRTEKVRETQNLVYKKKDKK